MDQPPIETRCRITPDGVTTCPEVSTRLDRIRQADELGLPTAGLERQIDLHLKGLRLHDEAER